MFWDIPIFVSDMYILHSQHVKIELDVVSQGVFLEKSVDYHLLGSALLPWY